MQASELTFTALTKADIPALTPIMKRSFDEDARLFFQKPEGGPPGYDDGSFLHKWALHPAASAYCVLRNGTLIGAFILFIREQESAGHLGCIFLAPEQCGKGCGTAVWQKIEQLYPQIKTWTVETPAVSYRNHCFYINKCGFRVIAVEGGRDRFEAQFQLKKVKA